MNPGSSLELQHLYPTISSRSLCGCLKANMLEATGEIYQRPIKMVLVAGGGLGWIVIGLTA